VFEIIQDILKSSFIMDSTKGIKSLKKKLRIRGTIDFYRYLFRINRIEGISLAVGLTLFIISLSSILNSLLLNRNVEVFNNTNIFFILLFGFSLFNISWDFWGKYQEIKKFTKEGLRIRLVPKRTIVKDDICISMSNLVPEAEKGWKEYECITLSEGKEEYNICGKSSNAKIAIYSPEINEYLWDKELKVEIKKQKEKDLEAFINKNKDISIPFFQYKYYNARKENKMLFNEEKLSMGSDITLGCESVACYRSDYFNSLLTNEISGYVLQREDGTVIYNATNFYPCEYDRNKNKAVLQTLKMSSLSNHIGISTLAFTQDNYLVIRRQNSKNQQNANQLVPTGSGSCDWGDLKGSSLRKTIQYAMQRELWEENGGKLLNKGIDEIGDTKVLGFFRWIDRGGKPEFIGITKLNCNVDDLKANSEELQDLSNRSDRDLLFIESIEQLIKILKELIEDKYQISLPLYMCIQCVLQYAEKRGSELQSFLKLT